MDADRFDTLARSLTTVGSRRRTLGGLLLGVFGLLSSRHAEDAAAHDLSAKCKNKSGKQKKKCLKKAKAHNAQHAAETPAPPCIGRCALTKPCGPDGCGGVCGTCAANESCQSATCVCVPNCPGKNCGDDGCGGSCGPCNPEDGGSCQDGVCICTQETCGGVCVAACNVAQERNPDTCGCCTANNQFCDPFPAPEQCCSGQCGFTSDGYRCFARLSGEQCDFGAQCLSGRCEQNCSGDFCTIDTFCQP